MTVLAYFLLALHYFASCLATAHAANPRLTTYPFTPIPLNALFDNQAASINGTIGDFDSHGGTFPAKFLPTRTWTYDGITYDLPETWGAGNDNLILNAQTLTIDKPTKVQEIHILYAGDSDSVGQQFSSNFTLLFANNSTQTIQLYGKNWLGYNKCPIQAPFNFLNYSSSTNGNISQVCQWSTSVFSDSALLNITLPAQASPRLHLFGLAFSPSSNSAGSGPILSVRRARFSQRWEQVGNVRAQAVEVTLANLLPSSNISAANSITSSFKISITGSHLSTVQPGTISRLVPADQVHVDIFVTGARDNDTAIVQVHDEKGNLVGETEFNATALVTRWTPDNEQLAMHETPTWWNQAKYGIFIHWGVFSVPAWGPPDEYAEWYNWDLHQINSSTWSHHKETYGPDVHYDQFVANFSASQFNASAWVDLFDQAGAKYFVLVTKHHDGWALFDTGNTTNRSLTKFGPKRDFVHELLTTAKAQSPNLHRGTYFSLPEWFNPDYAKYGFSQWPGGLSHNPFILSVLEPYTGHLNISDYIQDLQLPQMLDIALKYDTEMMWCDIGGPNSTPEFAAQFFNHAMAQGRQVTLNNRCGSNYANDFDTPEYVTFGNTVTNSWESSEGMDPFSYGYNSATNASAYKTGEEIIQTLVDIVSKNGNYLLDIGPTETGSVIPAMTDNLLQAGSWLKYAGDCVYNTQYWFPVPQDIGTAATRFTTTLTTFCAITFEKPSGGRFVVDKRIPILEGDKVFLLSPGSRIAKTPLSWTLESNGSLVVHVSDDALNSVTYAWAFQVQYMLT